MTNRQSRRSYLSFFYAIYQPPINSDCRFSSHGRRILGLHRARYSVFMVPYTAPLMITIWNHLDDYNHPSNWHFNWPAFWVFDVDQLCAFSADHCDERRWWLFAFSVVAWAKRPNLCADQLDQTGLYHQPPFATLHCWHTVYHSLLYLAVGVGVWRVEL